MANREPDLKPTHITTFLVSIDLEGNLTITEATLDDGVLLLRNPTPADLLTAAAHLTTIAQRELLLDALNFAQEVQTPADRIKERLEERQRDNSDVPDMPWDIEGE